MSAAKAAMDPARMWAGLREREALGVFIELDFAFGLVKVTELLLEDGVFMVRFLVGFGVKYPGWEERAYGETRTR
jgi:hypothetical protein